MKPEISALLPGRREYWLFAHVIGRACPLDAADGATEETDAA